ncbi:SDR family NAD(P)-dependent oxidoreductase [Sporosarcina sp. HYO08]|uniref:SDR family NAD(P)-dependent oxidoreductase n=1 Tax=Sporosarcina sp. HYO08 TaxID=1759557 RepID=UPI0007982D49|nr:SDR family NAD(P)-dependent oxidoreductase [Sporosarcina sp. HYO08]KXH87138.1 short-chain dehydrogenase [Sporosarcina sp. HYO08]
MDVFIITGASKGIGFELSKQLQAAGKKVIGMARTNPENADSFVAIDLSNTEQLESIMASCISQHRQEATSFTLINNAGMVEPIGLVGSLSPEDISKALAVNLTAPIILSNTFIKQLNHFSGKKKIVNISSGAGRKVYEGWGVYCTTKAGLDHFSRVVAVEQENTQHPVSIVSIAPGIIDTGMQETIRQSNADQFPLIDRFVDYKEQGLLSSAEEIAAKLIRFIESDDFETSNPIADLREI